MHSKRTGTDSNDFLVFVLNNGGVILKVIQKHKLLFDIVFVFIALVEVSMFKSCKMFSTAGRIFDSAGAEEDAELHHEGKV